MELRNGIAFLITLFCFSTSTNARDLPCAAQQIPGKSVVCVCNVTYCDTITRIPPSPGSFVVYTSSERGLRFQKTIGKLQTHIESDPCPGPTYTLKPSVRYQTVEGFGTSVTDAAGIMWSSIPGRLQKKLIDSYYGANGLEYSMIRVPIGGTDFSTHPYAYNDYPPYDVKLSNFSLAMEDYRYKIPMIKAIMKASPHKVHIIASTWSPPTWMKTNNAFFGYSRLIPDYYQTYADYHLKFLEGYAAAGIPIWAITTGNEPSDGMAGLIPLNCLGWNADSLASWIINNLGPTIRQSAFKDVKILCADDQRPMLPYWVTLDINHSVVGWIDWNMCLNKDGGPNWNGNDVDSPVIVLPELGQFIKQPMYYGMGHFSKFVPRGSRRIQISQNQEGLSMLSVAFVTPQNTVVVILYNQHVDMFVILYLIWQMFEDNPKVKDYVDGIAVHFYFDDVVPPTMLSELDEQYPDKFIIGTEATVVPSPGSGPAVNFGHWDRARYYVTDIINDINHSVVGWIDWNMCLNKDGGPNWNGNDVDSPVIVLPELGQFIKQPMYYGMGHFSKFVPRGSRRIQISQNQEGLSMLSVAFLTPQNTVVVVLYNQFPSSANIVLGGRQASIQLDWNSVTTIELPYK